MRVNEESVFSTHFIDYEWEKTQNFRMHFKEALLKTDVLTSNGFLLRSCAGGTLSSSYVILFRSCAGGALSSSYVRIYGCFDLGFCWKREEDNCCACN